MSRNEKKASGERQGEKGERGKGQRVGKEKVKKGGQKERGGT
jgi:hypothetical protein